MIDIRITGTGIEIEKVIKCLKQDYQIGSVSKLYPTSHSKQRCYIKAAHKKQCKLCRNFRSEESTGLCPECLAAMEEEL